MMSFTTMVFAEADSTSTQGSDTVIVKNNDDEEFVWHYGYEKVTRSYAGFVRYIFIGIIVLAAVTMILVEKKKFYRKPDDDPNKEKSTFDRIFKV